jgi:two-component system, NarL family, response regulator
MPPSKPARLRLLIAEDHFVTRMGLKAIFGAEPDIDVVAEAETGADAVALYRKHRPDVAVVDLRMPGLGGVEVVKEIRAEFSDARLIILTGSEGSEGVYRALQAGARAYLLKDAKGTELVRALRDVHAGKRVVPPEVAVRLAERVPQSDLSPRELEVLRHVADGKSNKRIADALGLSEATVRTHVSNILSKLGVDDRTQAATEALRRGILSS